MSNERTNVKLFPTALATDVLFYVNVSSDLPRNQLPVYGTPYRTAMPYAVDNFPNHQLVFISPNKEPGSQRWYFAADRENQDLYNWDISQGEQLIRGYLVPRHLYYARSTAEALAAIPLINNEFTHPIVPTPDTRFVKYGFADDTVVEAPDELKSLYIVVKRRYIEPVTVDFVFDDSLQRNISITKQIIPAGSGQPPTSIAGIEVEIQNGNVFHDVKITRQIILAGSTYPYELPPLPSTYSRPFPAKLESVELVWAWARAWQLTEPIAPESYSEDYYFKFRIIEPRPGPYDATVRRFVTNDPAALKVIYPITIVPQPITESIAVASSWFYASPAGNRTSATAKEWSVPATIHPAITVTLSGKTTPLSDKYYTTTLAATPGVSVFLGLSSMNVDYDVKQLPLGLYEVSVVIADISGLYS
jgi:hypothetical protein